MYRFILASDVVFVMIIVGKMLVQKQAVMSAEARSFRSVACYTHLPPYLFQPT